MTALGGYLSVNTIRPFTFISSVSALGGFAAETYPEQTTPASPTKWAFSFAYIKKQGKKSARTEITCLIIRSFAEFTVSLQAKSQESDIIEIT